MPRVVLIAGVMLGALSVSGALAGTDAGASTLIQQVSSDTLTATPSIPAGIHHATEVETDTFAAGNTVVSSFQVGRLSSYGAIAMGWATSTDGGQTWQHGLLPGVSAASPSPNSSYVAVANQSVMFDAAHGTWLIPTVAVVACSSLAPSPVSCVGGSVTEHTLLVNRSADGLTWSQPVVAVPANVDKPWGVCDNTPTSPYYGTCYVAYAQIDDGDRLALIHSNDGGLTWSSPVTTTSGQIAYNTNPVVQPDGQLVIVATDIANGSNGSRLLSFTSNDGGSTLSDAATGPGALPVIQYHTPAGGIRAKNKPSVDVDAAGTIYVAWSDCRFRTQCAENDIVYAESTDGVNYSSPIRVPADPLTSTVDHFIPGLAVRPGTSGNSAELGVVYYSYPNASCTTSTCRLNVEFSSSINGGASWTTTQLDTTPMQLSWLAPTNLGPAVGDYESVSYVDGHAVTVFPLASAPQSGVFNEAENAATFPWAGGSSITTVAGSGQSVDANASFGTPLQVEVVNSATDTPAAGVTVTFSAPTTGASGTFAGGSTSATAVTDGNGMATAPTFTANSIAGGYLVTADAGSDSAQFSLTNAGVPATITVVPGSSPQGAPTGTPFANDLSVLVRDAQGTPSAGTQVSFSAPSSGASGTFSSPGTGSQAVAVTNNAGVAVAPSFTADSQTGAYDVQVQAGSASTVVALTNTNGLPASITVTGGNNQATTVGKAFALPLSVKVADASGQPYPGATVTFSAPAAHLSGTFVGSGSNVTTVQTGQSGVATVPVAYAGATTGTYTVTATVNGVNAKFTLTVAQAGSPIVTSISPSSGSPAGGTTVSVTGTGFTGATAVHFGTIAASTFTVNSTTSITATSPSGTGVVDVTVTTPTGTSPAVTGDRFTYNAGIPAVTSLSPSSGSTAGGTTVTVTGTGFTGALAVDFGTASAAFTVNSATSITATSPSGSGVVDVTVQTPNGTSQDVTGDRFTYNAGSPVVTGISPSSGTTAGGTTVTVTGTGFTGALAVDFGTASATFTVNSATSITATSPSGTGVVDVTVETPNGTSQDVTGDRFTYIAGIPVVTSLSPSSGSTAGGTTVTVTGTGFTGTTSVVFGTVAASSFTVVSDTEITAVSPAQAASARYVFVTTPGGKSAAGTAPKFTYKAPVPVVTSISPSSGSPAGGTTVTVTGTGFTGTTSVVFGTVAASSFTVVSDTEITAVSPAQAASSRYVFVTTPGGKSAAGTAPKFTYT